MWLADFISRYWSTIFVSLITSGLLAYCRYLSKQIKRYKDYQSAEEQKKFNKALDIQLEPLIKDVEELRTYIINLDNRETSHINLLVSSFRCRLIALCKAYIEQDYITLYQHEKLSDYYQLYSSLGGNGQAKEYYEIAINLPIKH